MVVIDYSTSLKALDLYIKGYNEKYDSLTDKIRQGTGSTAKEIIRAYGTSLMKANKKEEIDINKIPSFKTNNIHLSKLTNASSRTIQRHVLKLQQAGIITEKIFHGSKANYDLFINPEILLVNKKITPKEVKFDFDTVFGINTDNQQVKNNKVSICPNREPSNNSYNNNLIMGVNNSEELPFSESLEDKKIRDSLPLMTSNESGNNATGYTKGKEAENIDDTRGKGWKKRVENTKNQGFKPNDNSFQSRTTLPFLQNKSDNKVTGYTRGKGVGNIENTRNKGPEKWDEDTKNRRLKTNESDFQTRSTSLFFYVELLWSLALNTIYSQRSLSQWQIDNAKKLILKLYEPVTTSSLPSIHQKYVERISWQWESIQRKPKERYALLPHQYFDPNISHGFVGTKQHYLNEKIKQAENLQKRITSQQIRRYNENLQKATHEQKPLLLLYRNCEQRVNDLDNKDLLKHFHSAIVNPESQSQLYS